MSIKKSNEVPFKERQAILDGYQESFYLIITKWIELEQQAIALLALKTGLNHSNSSLCVVDNPCEFGKISKKFFFRENPEETVTVSIKWFDPTSKAFKAFGELNKGEAKDGNN